MPGIHPSGRTQGTARGGIQIETMASISTDEPQLRRGLTLTDALALTVGTIIGTGIFLKTAVMGQLLGSPLAVLAAWVAAGLLSLAGALTYAELGDRKSVV